MVYLASFLVMRDVIHSTASRKFCLCCMVVFHMEQTLYESNG